MKAGISLYQIVIVVLLITNVCFYNEDHIGLYQYMTIIPVMIIIIDVLRKDTIKLYFSHEITRYMLTIYSMFTLYGLLFLKAGDYNDDMIIFDCVQNLCLYVCFHNIFLKTDGIILLAKCFMYAGFFIVLYILSMERELIFAAQVEERIGESLSGNVNTVGFSLGIISFVVAFYFIKTKELYILFFYLPLVAMMLLTGSKKTVVILLVELLMMYIYADNKYLAFIKTALLVFGLYYVIFNISIFYDLIGFRIEDMFSTMLGSGNGNYSHSTDDREGMISEGFKIWLTQPIFGGGMNYFAYSSREYGFYGYSHCNYTEILCNFGIMGLVVYYKAYINNIKFFYKIAKVEKDAAVLMGLWLATSLILGWCMVQFSDICISYIPITASFAMIEVIKNKMYNRI